MSNPITEFRMSADQYKVIRVCIVHIRAADFDALVRLADADDDTIMIRNTGALVKVHEREPTKLSELELELEDDHQELSFAFYKVMAHARAAGFTAVEFDSNATIYNTLPTYDW